MNTSKGLSVSEMALAVEEAPERAESEHAAAEILQAVLSRPLIGLGTDRKPVTSVDEQIDGVVIGQLVMDSGSDDIRVDHPHNSSGEMLPFITTVAVNTDDVGREVALAFQQGDPSRPILIGLIQPPKTEVAAATAKIEKAAPLDVTLDDERLILTAQKEIVLRCGKASITLTKAGKILIRGAYLSNHSSGVNRIKGGSVQIN